MPIDNVMHLEKFLNELLQPQRFKDYCPNGLQVEGRREIKKIISGVTACQALINAAIESNADAILVHHGLFWRGEVRITGWMRCRLAQLLEHGIHLLAYHLPLDAHPQLGNNAQLARILELEPQLDALQQPVCFGEQNLAWLGTTKAGTLGGLIEHIEQHLALKQLGRSIISIGASHQPIHRVAWCTGGAQSYFEAAIAQGVDAFITGEISEPQAHYSRETGVAYIACGHHATERYGAAAVAQAVANHFGLAHEFIDIDNPA